MLRSAIFATTALAFSTSAIADERPITTDIRVDTAKIVDATTAQKAFRSVERQAERACGYELDANRRAYVDELCVDEILQKVTVALDLDAFTEVYANSKKAVKVAERKED